MRNFKGKIKEIRYNGSISFHDFLTQFINSSDFKSEFETFVQYNNLCSETVVVQLEEYLGCGSDMKYFIYGNRLYEIIDIKEYFQNEYFDINPMSDGYKFDIKYDEEKRNFDEAMCLAIKEYYAKY